MEYLSILTLIYNTRLKIEKHNSLFYLSVYILPKKYYNTYTSLRSEQTRVEHLLGLPTNIRIIRLGLKKETTLAYFIGSIWVKYLSILTLKYDTRLKSEKHSLIFF